MEAIEDFFVQSNQQWTGSKGNSASALLQTAVSQTIGIALKSAKAATYIDWLMELEEEAQEALGAIVQSCLESIEDGGNSGRFSA